MKTMAGALALACSNRSRTRLAPTPTNISTKSEPEMEKNGTPASPATARASRVLPVPGRPEQQHALGDLGPEGLEAAGRLEELLDLLQLGHRLVGAGDVGEGHLGLVLAGGLGLGLAELHHLGAAALQGVDQEEDQPEEEDDRQVGRTRADSHGLDLACETLTVGARGQELGGQRLGQAVGVLDDEVGAVFELARSPRRCCRG